MEFKELKKKSEADLHKVLSEKREELRELRFKDANKQLKNVREIRTLKKTIAQSLTLLNSLLGLGKAKSAEAPVIAPELEAGNKE
jgi:large subunit ribosomal protein L29